MRGTGRRASGTHAQASGAGVPPPRPSSSAVVAVPKLSACGPSARSGATVSSAPAGSPGTATSIATTAPVTRSAVGAPSGSAPAHAVQAAATARASAAGQVRVPAVSHGTGPNARA